MTISLRLNFEICHCQIMTNREPECVFASNFSLLLSSNENFLSQAGKSQFNVRKKSMLKNETRKFALKIIRIMTYVKNPAKTNQVIKFLNFFAQLDLKLKLNKFSWPHGGTTHESVS